MTRGDEEEKATTIPSSKDGLGSSFMKCPMLNSSNYTVWAIKMKLLLKVHKAWEVVEKGLVDETKNDMAIMIIFQSIPETLVLQFGELETAKEVWNAIKSRHLGADRVKEARLQTLNAEFDRLSMKDSENIDDFSGRIAEISSKSISLGEEIEESKMVKKFLSSLPEKYIQIVASLEQVLDLKTTSFEDIIGRLKAYEERVNAKREESKNEQEKLMYANEDSRQNSGGRGGRSSWRGRGRGRFGNQQRDSTHITCYRCDKLGHYASDCPERLLKLQEAVEKKEEDDTQEADGLMMHEVICIEDGKEKKNEVVYLNEKNVKPKDFETCSDANNIWYLDNGASNHMTGNRDYFKVLDESVYGKVRFGDDSRIDIKGKGSILFISKNGDKKILGDVYYLPDLKSNIISLGQATESGCDVRMREDYLTLHDKNGNLITKAKRSKNRLYKVIMESVDSRCLQLTTQETSSRWHARLGHIGNESMKSMVNKEMVIGIPKFTIEREICSSCLLGKQTRKSFPQATSYRATQLLELVHGDLCGPITPPTPSNKRYIFVIIDDNSRYMWSILLKEKGEAFEKFKRFKALVELETKVSIKTFRTDRGGEFMSQEFQSFCEKEGINRHLTAPYSPQQNGVVERRNRTLMGMTRSMLKHMNMPNTFWGEAVRHSTYLINRVATRVLIEKTPYEAFKGKRPNIEHLRIFGCIGYAKTEAPHLKKLDDRTRVLVHLGTEPGSKAYRLFDPKNHKIIVSRDVIFDEEKNWNFDSSQKELETDPGSFRVHFGEFGNNGLREIEENREDEEETEENRGGNIGENIPVEIEETDAIDESNGEDEDGEEEEPLRRSLRPKRTPKYLEDYVQMSEIECEHFLMLVNEEPWNFEEAKSSKKVIIRVDNKSER